MSAPKPIRMNWPTIMRDLDARGWSPYRISDRLEVSESTAQRWRCVIGDIGHGYGQALLALHTEVCGASSTLQRITEAEALA